MAAVIHIMQPLAVASFVLSSALKASRISVAPPADMASYPLVDRVMISTTDLPLTYLQPQNPVMWLLLLTLWLLLIFDAISSALARRQAQDHDDFTLLMVLALLAGVIWPWVISHARPVGSALAVMMTGAALLAALRARVAGRPAVCFLAGWSTGIGVAVIAGVTASHYGLSGMQVAALAILPTALIGILVQYRIGHSVSYTGALIWAFCGLAVTTMGSQPSIAIAAILGATALTTVLIRAAS